MVKYDRGEGGFLRIIVVAQEAVVCANFDDAEVCIVVEPTNCQRSTLATAIQNYWHWATEDKLVWPEDLDIKTIPI